MKSIALTLKTLIPLTVSTRLPETTQRRPEAVQGLDAATLDRLLDGVGPSKAQAIVMYRKANGPFRSAADLAKVKGIGDATVKRNAARISVGAARTAVPAAAKKAPAR